MAFLQSTKAEQYLLQVYTCDSSKGLRSISHHHNSPHVPHKVKWPPVVICFFYIVCSLSYETCIKWKLRCSTVIYCKKRMGGRGKLCVASKLWNINCYKSKWNETCWYHEHYDKFVKSENRVIFALMFFIDHMRWKLRCSNNTL